MSDAGVIVTLSPRDYDAILFDLDGVLTRTASVHVAAWKKLFDAFPERRADETGEPFVPFDIDAPSATAVPVRERKSGVPRPHASRAARFSTGGLRNCTPSVRNRAAGRRPATAPSRASG